MMSVVHSNNHRASDAWYQSWTHLHVDRRSPGYCRVTFDHPPANALTATTVDELAEVAELIGHDPDLNVVVFDTANPEFFLTDDDAARSPAWPELLVTLSRAPVVSIASIRGRARGAGSEFALACDLRFGSRENTLVGGFEAGAGARLSRLVGRGRALEIMLFAEDLDGVRAERYGFVDRVIADDDLDDEVEAIASRLAGLEHDAIARTKSSVDRVRLPDG
jgi:enoyl-CoA hydratase/carnithine racemase